MARYFRTNKKVQFYQFNSFGLERTYVRQPSLVDSFFFTDRVCPETGEKVYSFSHPLYMLFNQERLDRLGPAAVQQWLKSLDSANNSSLTELRSKCSDNDLLSMVKSRHIQHPCELERYIKSLNERAEFFNSEVARVVAEEKAQLQQQQQTVVPSPKSE